MSRLHIAFLAIVIVLLASPTQAYVWRCQSSHGAIWTDQRAVTDDCEEYDSLYNPSAAPEAVREASPRFASVQTAPVQNAALQIAPLPGPPIVVLPPPPPYPPYYYAYPYPYYAPYAPGLGLYLYPPAFLFGFGPAIVTPGPHFGTRHHFRWH